MVIRWCLGVSNGVPWSLRNLVANVANQGLEGVSSSTCLAHIWRLVFGQYSWNSENTLGNFSRYILALFWHEIRWCLGVSGGVPCCRPTGPTSPKMAPHYQPCSNLCCQQKLFSLTATNAPNPKDIAVCEALQFLKIPMFVGAPEASFGSPRGCHLQVSQHWLWGSKKGVDTLQLKLFNDLQFSWVEMAMFLCFSSWTLLGSKQSIHPRRCTTTSDFKLRMVYSLNKKYYEVSHGRYYCNW